MIRSVRSARERSQWLGVKIPRHCRFTFSELRKRATEAAEEDSYRQSRLCRLLGNPVAFAIVELLADNKELNPSEIARAVGRSVPRVSNVLDALRLADVVRYDSDGERNYCRLKHPGEIRQILAALSRFVKAASTVATHER